jgi:spore coat polysaccharide biosynthesis protein SpsF (cytidylyltransferase family)
MATKTLIITQARTGSSRLPGKVLKTIENKTLLQIHLDRLKKAKNISNIIVATTTKEEDEVIFNLAKELGYESFRGAENDVLDRYYQAAKLYNPEWVVRVTSDCPLLDPELLDDVISFIQKEDADYGTNCFIIHYPDGQDIEVFKFSALEKAWNEATLKSDREHVTTYIRRNADIKGGELFTGVNYPCEKDYSKIRMTVDEPPDFELIKKLVTDLGVDKTWIDYTNYIINNDLMKINEGIARGEGYIKSLKND